MKVFILLAFLFIYSIQQKTVFIAGDSTVQSYKDSYYPQQGWGYYLGKYVPKGFKVANHALGGRSAKSFINEGRLDTILKQMKKGDYLVVQFGINDAAKNKADRYSPVSGKLPGTKDSFEYFMAKYIEGTKAKGGIPILISTVISERNYNTQTKQFSNSGSINKYADAMIKIAKYYNVNYVDLTNMMVKLYNKIGYEKVKTYHLDDRLHFTVTGAEEVAKLLSTELNKFLK